MQLCNTRHTSCCFLHFPHNTSLLLCVALLFVLIGCSSKHIPSDNKLYLTTSLPGIDEQHTPSFLVVNAKEPHNRIGTPTVRANEGEEELYVDSSKPTVYHEIQTFRTARSKYKNHIYRINFEKVPFSWSQLHLTAGKNPGLLIIYTLNSRDQLYLVTTVHSCGCYLAFFPTDALSQEAYPTNWPKHEQSVFGYTLPAGLPISQSAPENKILFTLADGSHRISNVTLFDPQKSDPFTKHTRMVTAPLSSLYTLAFGDKTVSFFETTGARMGYVKNNTKWLERLLIGWWALDLRVGEDKAYGKDDKSTTPLYTSLKFWHREESDLKNFPRFLEYWGWKL